MAGNKISRRDIIKGLATVPVFGYLGFSFFKKKQSEDLITEERKNLYSELGLDFQPGYPGKKFIVKKVIGDHLRIGIIGAGNRGKSLLRSLGFVDKSWIKSHTTSSGQPDKTLQDFLNRDKLNISLTAACDVFDMHLQQAIEISAYNKDKNDFSGIPAKGYKDYRKLLEDKNVDAVIIATPDFWHGPIAIEAIKAGKHVYCEKCMTNSEEEAVALYDTVKSSNMVLQVGHQYSQNDCFPRAQYLLRNNKIGKVTLIETTSNRNSEDSAWVRHLDGKGNTKPGTPETLDWNMFLGKAPKVPFDLKRFYNWSLYWDYSTGVAGQLMSHEFDVANQLMGLGIPGSVVAEGGVFFHKEDRETPDIFNVLCNYPEKELTFIYSASLASNRERGRIFMGHDGSLEVDNNIRMIIDRESTQYASYIKSRQITPGKVFFEYRQGIGDIDAVTSPTEQYYASKGLTYTMRDGKKADTSFLHLKNWLDCIRFGGTPACDIEKGFEVTITCMMATKAYREKRRVRWDAGKRRIV
ncbi:MAG: Gfo/Idh/MocA family oxidoreductase [Bacteroidales bacterium]|nr:Gfo/Idh/MocA family oxidoreductase [Bacteroidales bacterium]